MIEFRIIASILHYVQVIYTDHLQIENNRLFR